MGFDSDWDSVLDLDLAVDLWMWLGCRCGWPVDDVSFLVPFIRLFGALRALDLWSF